MSRRSNLKSEEWIRREYTRLFKKYASSSSGLSTSYFNRARWLFYRNIYPTLVLKQGNQQYHDSFLDACISDLVEAQSIINQWVPPHDFKKKLLSVLELRKSERPEYVAWFKSSFCTKEIKKLDEIIQLYESVLGADGFSIQRQIFCRKHLGYFLLQNRKFKQALSIFRPLAASNEEFKKLFVQSVLESPDPFLNELRECLELGSCDTIETILSIFETEKERKNIRETLLSDDFSDHDQGMLLFFNTCNYEACAMIQLVLESEESFFLTDARNKTPDFVQNIMDRVNKLLEIPVKSSKVEKYAFRQSRLKMTKFKIQTQAVERNIETLNTLRDARAALHLCISKYFKLSSSCLYPHAINTIQQREKETLKKEFDDKRQYDRELQFHLENRLKEWMPCQESVCFRNGVDYVVIEDLVREALTKKGEIAKEIVNFVAKREHRIITKEAAWHSIWMKRNYSFKYNGNARVINKLEKKLNEYRDITKMFTGAKMTGYDLAHKAADFVEQTLVLFETTVVHDVG